MFDGLVATASSRSGSQRSRSATSPPNSGLASPDSDGAAADRHAPSFASPHRFSASSPRTTGAAPDSADFLSPFSVGGYPTPSTTQRRGRYMDYSTFSPSAEPHDLDGSAMEERDDSQCDVAGDAPSPPRSASASSSSSSSSSSLSPSLLSTRRLGGPRRFSQAIADSESGRSDPAPPPHARAVDTTLTASHLSSSADRHKSLAELACGSSASSSSLSPSAPGESPYPRGAAGLPLHSSGSPATRSLGTATASPHSSPRPVVASTTAVPAAPLSTAPLRGGDAAVFSRSTRSLSPLTTPPPPPLRPAAAAPLASVSEGSSEVGEDGEEEHEGEGEIHGSGYGGSAHQLRHGVAAVATHSSGSLSSPSPDARSSSSSAVSTPCAPPLSSPPTSAMKRPPGAVVVEPADDHDASCRCSESRLAVESTLLSVEEEEGDDEPKHEDEGVEEEREVHDAAASRGGDTFFFGVVYTEEEHRVQLETQETEERRCLFRAYRAILALYEMWAAESVNNDSFASVEGREAQPLFLMERGHAPQAGAAAGTASVRSASAASTTERVEHFLRSSVHSAKERRSGSAKSTASAPLMPVPAAAASTLSTSRLLDYSSSLLRPEPSLLASSTRPQYASTQRHPPSTAMPPPLASRLFSPWHEEQRAASSRHSPLVPQLRRTSPLSTRLTDRHVQSSTAPSLGVRGSSSSSGPSAGTGARFYQERREENEVGEARGRGSAERVPPPSVPMLSSTLSGQFLALARQRQTAGLEDEGRRSVASRWRTVSPALVQSPRTGAATTTTPPWNLSPHLRSPSSASRGLSPPNPPSAGATAVTATQRAAAHEGLRYTPNRAFLERQRAAAGVPPSSTDPPLPQDRQQSRSPPRQPANRRTAASHRERLTSYVQYKRFFDAVYGAGSDSPVETRRRQAKEETRRDGGAAASSSAVAVERRNSGGGAPHVLSALSSAPGAAAWRRRRWSPDAQARRAVPQPTAPAGSALTQPQQDASLSVWLTSRRTPGPLAVEGQSLRAMYAARFDRLDTLEKLCRAELQRRWMEDQNVLLHRFVVEGSKTIQRARVAAAAAAPAGLRGGSASRTVKEAGAWTFIPNEVD